VIIVRLITFNHTREAEHLPPDIPRQRSLDRNRSGSLE